jgi:hypothetical protein
MEECKYLIIIILLKLVFDGLTSVVVGVAGVDCSKRFAVELKRSCCSTLVLALQAWREED